MFQNFINSASKRVPVLEGGRGDILPALLIFDYLEKICGLHSGEDSHCGLLGQDTV
jgi:hypothetical protein